MSDEGAELRDMSACRPSMSGQANLDRPQFRQASTKYYLHRVSLSTQRSVRLWNRALVTTSHMCGCIQTQPARWDNLMHRLHFRQRA